MALFILRSDLELYAVMNSVHEFDLIAVEKIDHVVMTKTHGYGSMKLLECVGAAKMFALMHRVPLVQIAPNTWRKAVTGSGKATKEQCRQVLRRTVVGFPKEAGLDRSDACAIAIAGAMGAGR
jgi:Holliday junction resolvasome RuvABC endonuclease subunit